MYLKDRGQLQPKAALETSTPAMDLFKEKIDVIKNSMGKGLSPTSKEKNDIRSYLLKYKYFLLAAVLASVTLLDGRSCTYSWMHRSCIAVDSRINVYNHNNTFNSSQFKTIPSNYYLQTNNCGRTGLSSYINEGFFDGMKKQIVPSWLQELGLKRFVRWWSEVKRRWLSPPSSPTKLVDPKVGCGFVIGMLLIPPLLLLLQTDVSTATCATAGAGVFALIVTCATPSVVQALLWVQSDRLLLLAAALSWNAAICDTGLYDVLAAYAAKCKSSVVVCALWATAAIGAYADHVVCTALLTPLIIRLMEEHKLDPRPVVAAASALADLSSHLCARTGAFKRALDAELGETHEPVVWGVLTFCAAAAYYGVAFLLFKPHQYKEDYCMAELHHEQSLWLRVKLTTPLGARGQDFIGRVIDKELRALRLEIERLEKGPRGLTPSYHRAQTNVRLRNSRLLWWLCTVVAAFAVYKYFRAMGLVGDSSEGVMERTATWAMLALLLLTGPRLPLNNLASRIDITTLLTYAAANFYGNVLVVLRFPEVVANYLILPYMVGSPRKVISVCSCAVFWISAVLSACTGSGAARPLAATVRNLRVHSRAVPSLMTSVASAATLGHAIGSTAFVASSPGAQAGATAGAQQGYRLCASAYARLMLPLVALLLTAAHYCHLKHNLFV